MANEIMEDNLDILRPTGNMERFNIVRNQLKIYRHLGVTARYVIPSSIIENFGLLHVVYSVLHQVVNQNPILAVTLEDEETPEPKWSRLHHIDLSKSVKIIEVDDTAYTRIDEWIQQSLRTNFLEHAAGSRLPLWQIRIFQSIDITSQNSAGEGSTAGFQLGFFCHHAISDGLSSGAFHLNFLDALVDFINSENKPPASSEHAHVIRVQKTPLLPTLEAQRQFSLSTWYVLKKIVATYIYSAVDPRNWSGPLIATTISQPPVVSFRSFTISKEPLAFLLAKTRKEGATITSLVTVLVARKLAQIYPQHSTFTGAIPFSLRKFTGHGPRDMGCYVASIEPVLTTEKSTLEGHISCQALSEKANEDPGVWDSARACKKFIVDNTSSPHNQNVALLKYVNDLRKYFLGMLGQKRTQAFEITNLGVLDGVGNEATPRAASLDHVCFSSGVSTYSCPYTFCLASVKGAMCIGLSWDEEVLPSQEAIEVLDWLQDMLKQLGEGA